MSWFVLRFLFNNHCFSTLLPPPISTIFVIMMYRNFLITRHIQVHLLHWLVTCRVSANQLYHSVLPGLIEHVKVKRKTASCLSFLPATKWPAWSLFQLMCTTFDVHKWHQVYIDSLSGWYHSSLLFSYLSSSLLLPPPSHTLPTSSASFISVSQHCTYLIHRFLMKNLLLLKSSSRPIIIINCIQV